MAFPFAAVAMAGGSILGGLSSAKASSNMADAQLAAAEKAADVQKYIYDDTVAREQPLYDMGIAGIDPYMNSLGLYKNSPDYSIEYVPGSGGSGGSSSGGGVRSPIVNAMLGAAQSGAFPSRAGGMPGSEKLFGQPSSGSGGSSGYYTVGGQQFDSREAAQDWINNEGTTWENRGFQETPGYQYNMEQMQDQVDRSASAGGRRLSGATIKELMRNASGIANQEYGTYQNRLADLVGRGQQAVSSLGTAGTNYANSMSGIYGQQGQARASAYEGQANALNSVIGNLGSTYMMNKLGAFA